MIEEPGNKAIEALRGWIAERAESGNWWAQSVHDVTMGGEGEVTVQIDPETRKGITVDQLLGNLPSSFESIAELFATPVSTTSSKSAMMREHIATISVKDVKGNLLGSVDTGEQRRKSNP